MVVYLFPALQEAMEVCEQAAQRVTTLELKMRRFTQFEIPRSTLEDYENACRVWRNARRRWERLYIAAGGRL